MSDPFAGQIVTWNLRGTSLHNTPNDHAIRGRDCSGHQAPSIYECSRYWRVRWRSLLRGARSCGVAYAAVARRRGRRGILGCIRKCRRRWRSSSGGGKLWRRRRRDVLVPGPLSAQRPAFPVLLPALLALPARGWLRGRRSAALLCVGAAGAASCLDHGLI